MKIFKRIKSYYNNDELMFKISTGMKFVSISMFFFLLVLTFTFLIVKLDLSYFNSKGFPGAADFGDAFYGFVYESLNSSWPLLVFPLIAIFFVGYYVAIIMMRPFKVIARFCEERLVDQSMQYAPDLFSDLKLLTSFTAFFFARIDEAKAKGTFDKIEIPEGFTKIHKPVFEKNFFFNYFFLIIAFSLLASIGILMLNLEIHDQILILGKKIIKSSGNQETILFLSSQTEVFKLINEILLSLHIFIYCLFGIHLYGKVSTPAFAVFATMRSFLKGNAHNRIHLVGYSYLRDDCRKINKYLDHIQKTIVKK
jgi:hypothetical protein